jgi:hypothetical protein
LGISECGLFVQTACSPSGECGLQLAERGGGSAEGLVDEDRCLVAEVRWCHRVLRRGTPAPQSTLRTGKSGDGSPLTRLAYHMSRLTFGISRHGRTRPPCS